MQSGLKLVFEVFARLESQPLDHPRGRTLAHRAEFPTRPWLVSHPQPKLTHPHVDLAIAP